MPKAIAPERSNNDLNTRALAILRIGVGIFFLIFGQYKVFGTQFTLHGGFQFWINRFLEQGGAYPFMAPILRASPFRTPRLSPSWSPMGNSRLAFRSPSESWSARRAPVRPIFMLTLLFSSDYPGAKAPPGNISAQASATLSSLSALWFF